MIDICTGKLAQISSKYWRNWKTKFGANDTPENSNWHTRTAAYYTMLFFGSKSLFITIDIYYA